MGVSTDAHLFYGLEIHSSEDGIEFPESLYDLLAEHGHDEETYPSDIIDALLEILDIDGLDYDRHCHHEYPIYYIHTKRYWAWRGSSKSDLDLTIDPTWDAKIKAFCDATGIKYEQPTWHLASYWG